MHSTSNPIGILFGALRVYQWPKNLLVFGALVFGQQLSDSGQVMRSTAAFLLMCAASSAVYVFNDLRDVEKDRAHPEKCKRPFASGALSSGTGIFLLVGLIVISLGGANLLSGRFALTILVYMVVNLLYTTILKNVAILDVMSVAIGFVIRAIAGAVVLGVVFSNWLVVCTLFLALFLCLGKRRRELESLVEDAASHRQVLSQYSVPYLDSLILMMAACTLIIYVIYTCTPEVIDRLGTDKLYVTIPYVVYGLFRYLHLVHHHGGGGDPSRLLLQDWPLLTTVALWGLTCMGIIYAGHMGV